MAGDGGGHSPALTATTSLPCCSTALPMAPVTLLSSLEPFLTARRTETHPVANGDAIACPTCHMMLGLSLDNGPVGYVAEAGRSFEGVRVAGEGGVDDGGQLLALALRIARLLPTGPGMLWQISRPVI